MSETHTDLPERPKGQQFPDRAVEVSNVRLGGSSSVARPAYTFSTDGFSW